MTDTPYDAAMTRSKQELARQLVDADARIEALEFEVEHERYNVEKTAQEAAKRIKALEAALEAALRERVPSQEAIVKALLGNAVFANSFGTQHNAKLLARHLGDVIRALAPEDDK